MKISVSELWQTQKHWEEGHRGLMLTGNLYRIYHRLMSKSDFLLCHAGIGYLSTPFWSANTYVYENHVKWFVTSCAFTFADVKLM